MLAIYMNIPTDEALLYRQVCYKLYNASLCTSVTQQVSLPSVAEQRIQRSTSIYVMYLNLVYSIPSIFVSMICSAWSDRYSHRIPMILANIGCILATLVNIGVSTIRNDSSIELLFLSNILISLFGSTSTMFSIVYNYITYITTHENRTLRIGMLEACLLFGSTLGLLSSGFLLELLKFPMIFLLIIGLHLINIVYIVFYVDEVIQLEEEISSWKNFHQSLCIWKDIRASFRMLVKPRDGQQRRFLLLALLGLLGSM